MKELNEDTKIALNELMGFYLLDKTHKFKKEYLDTISEYYKRHNINRNIYLSFYNSGNGDFLNHMVKFVKFVSTRGYELQEIKDMIHSATDNTFYNAKKLLY